MSSLDNLTAKIIEDSMAKANRIISEAKAEAEAKIAREVAWATAEGEKIIADAKVEAQRAAEQLVQGKTLAIRDENLGAKREMLDKIFVEALKRLNGMPKDEYLGFLTGYLSKLDLNGEELIVPKRYGIKSVDELGAKLDLKLCEDEGRDIDGGFVLVNKGIEQNHTFAALMGYYRDELEAEVLKILYA